MEKVVKECNEWIRMFMTLLMDAIKQFISIHAGEFLFPLQFSTKNFKIKDFLLIFLVKKFFEIHVITIALQLNFNWI